LNRVGLGFLFFVFLFKALAMVEDETDVLAAKVLKVEVNADIAEFDENVSWEEESGKKKEVDGFDRVENELKSIENEVRFFFLENFMGQQVKKKKISGKSLFQLNYFFEPKTFGLLREVGKLETFLVF
jgi:hypothetical protein